MRVRETSGISDLGVGVGKRVRGPRVITCGLYYLCMYMYVSMVHGSKYYCAITVKKLVLY